LVDLDELITRILVDFGEAILPRIHEQEGLERILIIPHKLAYLLPLHAMMAQVRGKPIILDQLGASTYASSLMAHEWGGKLRRVKPDPLRRFLAYIDTAGLGSPLELDGYDMSLNGNDGINIMKDNQELPNDVGSYSFLSWSSHAFSDPTDWRASYLTAGSRRIYGTEIVESWSLNQTLAAMLSACETGCDKSADAALDEYFGLDLAVHIAGADTVVSTLWPVTEAVAGITSMFFTEGVVKHVQRPSEFMRRVRFDFASGRWREAVEQNYRVHRQELSSKGDVGRRFLSVFDRLLALDPDVFSSLSSWAAYRTFGGW